MFLTSNSAYEKHYSDKVRTEKLQHFDLDYFFNDIHFFFKLLSAPGEDYTFLESITNVVAEYAKKHAETRVLSMKYGAL